MRIAIAGCGIAGPTLAWWLRERGHEPLILEKAPEFRAGGYIMDFWGSGYDVAERMGILPELQKRGMIMERLRAVNAAGQTVARLDQALLVEITGGRYLSLRRGELAEVLYRACDGIEVRFGTVIEAVEHADDGLVLRLSGGAEERVDLVVGADGLHSPLRAMVFGPETQFERPMGASVAAFRLAGHAPREPLTYVGHAAPGRQIFRVALEEDQTLFLMVAEEARFPEPHGEAAQLRAALRAAFGDMGWEAPAILERLDEAEDIYADRMSQIRMDRWCSGRVALVGDAAAAPTLLAGEGAGLAMTEAYVLADCLDREDGSHVRAFANYERRLKAAVEAKQDAALAMRGFFVPGSRGAILARDAMINLMRLPWLGPALMRRSFGGGIDIDG